MRKIKLVFCFTFLFFSVFAQNEKILILEGEATTEFHDNETRETAQKRAKQNAINNALEKGFGTAINQTNNLQIKNTNIGQKTETKTVFNSISETSIRGDYTDVLNEVYEDLPFVKEKSNGVKINGIEIKCSVKIKARELKVYPVSFISYTLKCSDTSKCKTSMFKENDSLIVFLKTPKPGYISVFLDDNKISSYIFPQQIDASIYSTGYPVIADKEYLLFSESKSFKINDNTRPYRWVPSDEIETLYIIFSPTPIELPDLKIGTDKIPDYLKSIEFKKWENNLKLKNKEIEIKKIPLRSNF